MFQVIIFGIVAFYLLRAFINCFDAREINPDGSEMDPVPLGNWLVERFKSYFGV